MEVFPGTGAWKNFQVFPLSVVSWGRVQNRISKFQRHKTMACLASCSAPVPPNDKTMACLASCAAPVPPTKDIAPPNESAPVPPIPPIDVQQIVQRFAFHHTTDIADTADTNEALWSQLQNDTTFHRCILRPYQITSKKSNGQIIGGVWRCSSHQQQQQVRWVCVCVGWYVDASVPVCPLTSVCVVFVLFGMYSSARQVHGPRPERVSFPII